MTMIKSNKTFNILAFSATIKDVGFNLEYNFTSLFFVCFNRCLDLCVVLILMCLCVWALWLGVFVDLWVFGFVVVVLFCWGVVGTGVCFLVVWTCWIYGCMDVWILLFLLLLG